ncbi:MAG: hypothetical protein N2Z65_08380 [Clostridiales bacterium]|nr:hypothetical protein [Clostridiales bacterium]
MIILASAKHKIQIKLIGGMKVQKYDKTNEGQGNSGMMNPSYTMPGMEQYQYFQPPMMEKMMAYQAVYPDVFYKVQPFVMMACDQMDTYGSMPSQDMIEQMADVIYEDVRRMYPDLNEYVGEYERNVNSSSPDLEVVNHVPRSPGMFGRPFRQRGLFRDLIGILLLSELFRRRRRHY